MVETDDQVTRLLAALWDAWADCHDKLADVLARQREDRAHAQGNGSPSL